MSVYINYDLVMSDKNEMFLYLNSRWFWVNKPGTSESKARQALPKDRTWEKIQSLREIAKEATTEGTVEIDKTTEYLEFLKKYMNKPLTQDAWKPIKPSFYRER